MPLSLAGTLKDPYGNALPSAIIRFDAVITSSSVLNHISAEATTDATGTYAIQVEFGRYNIRVQAGRSFYDLARDVQINSDTSATTLNSLIVAAQGYDDLTPQIILEFQALRDETRGYRDEADASATAAATSEASADQSEAAALASQQAAATSETNAADSASAAATSETNAAGSETNAASSASAGATSETNAATSESNAAGSASAAATSETNAADSATSAQASLDQFQSVYYGPLASDPATDPNGDPPTQGDRYYNTTDGGERVFDGTAWAANDIVSHEQAADPHPQYLSKSGMRLTDTDDLDNVRGAGRYAWIDLTPANAPFGSFCSMAVTSDSGQALQTVWGSPSNQLAIRRDTSGVWSAWTHFLSQASADASYDPVGTASAAVSQHESKTDAHTPAQVGADPAGTAASAVTAHEAAADPHTQYYNQARGDVRYVKLSGANDFDTMPTVGGSPIVESGSNSAGEWTKWADGTQMCRVVSLTMPIDYSVNSTTVAGMGYSDPKEWVYPAPFSIQPTVTATAMRGINDIRKGFIHSLSNTVTSANLVLVLTSNDSAIGISASITAYGPWK